ncbi:MAG: GNAT family N-acetyltransferase [Sporichthyaceae bacterium]
MLDTATMRVLSAEDLPAAMRVLARDPVANVYVASRLLTAGLGTVQGGIEVWGYDLHGDAPALCYVGANVVPVQAHPAAVDAFAERAARLSRRCSSIVGDAAAVTRLWEQLAPVWGPAREVRASQPVMATCVDAVGVAPDPAVRLVRPHELDALVPACIAMFTEEVGVSPLGGDGGLLYRARVRELIDSGRSFARIENGRVLFKAEIGAATAAACQVQGVWVDPAYRGQGLGAAGMAAVVNLARRRIAPTVSLYVNDFNTAARATYRRVGFAEVGTFASVLF